MAAVSAPLSSVGEEREVEEVYDYVPHVVGTSKR